MKNILYKQNNFPIFQNVLYNTKEEALNCKVANIELIQDEKTGLIYNRLFDNTLMDYDADYSFDPSLSLAYRNIIVGVKDIVEKYLGKDKLLEVGCGKGFFTDYLSSLGFDIVGMDPCYEGESANIKKEYYNKNTNKSFNGIIMRHVLEHIENPYEFLLELKEANNNQGLVYIEVPCFDYINDNCCFTDIYYEHVNYFRKIDFENMFDDIIDIGNIFQGQYLYVVARLSSLKIPKKNDDFSLNKKFFSEVEGYKKLIKEKNKKTVIWGAGPRAQILSFFLRKENINIDYFVDINPKRENKYIALVEHYENARGGNFAF